MRRSIKSYAVVTAVSIGLSGCPSKYAPEQNLDSYHTVLSRYAGVLERILNPSGTELNRVGAAVGGQYAIGTALRAGTNSVLTDSCKADQSSILKTGFNPLPISKNEQSFMLDAGLPVSLQQALRDTLDLGLKIQTKSNMELSYAELRQEVLAEDTLRKTLSRADCLTEIAGKRIAVIRGYVYGKQRLIYGDNVDFDPTLKFVKLGDYTLKYTSKGGFSIEDSEARPQFVIIAEYSYENVKRPQKVAPSAATVQAITPKVPIEQVFKFPAQR